MVALDHDPAWRALLGFGMGGEWASGATLVAETWPAEHRTKAIAVVQSGWALGYILAAVAAAIVLDVLSLGAEAWRWLFLVGALPALLVWWIRRRLDEPAMWQQRRLAASTRVSPFATLLGPMLRSRYAAPITSDVDAPSLRSDRLCAARAGTADSRVAPSY